jgi:hypothetical protein
VLAHAPVIVTESSTREVRGGIVHWQANEPPVLPRYTLSISSQIFQVLLEWFLNTLSLPGGTHGEHTLSV